MSTQFCICLLLFIGCKNPTYNKSIEIYDSVKLISGNDIDYLSLDNRDSMSIVLDSFNAFTFSKSDVRQYLKIFPELNESIPKNPDIAYAIAVYNHCHPFIDSPNLANNFSSEAGKDAYYALYSFFLKNRNGIGKYKGKRDTLIRIYRDINSINQSLSGGGTYYGHQYARILAYAEYSVYAYNLALQRNIFKKNYSILTQKSFFLHSLKQLINDEMSDNNDFLDKQDKLKEKLELYSMVDEISILTTDYFYLKSGQSFQYTHY